MAKAKSWFSSKLQQMLKQAMISDYEGNALLLAKAAKIGVVPHVT